MRDQIESPRQPRRLRLALAGAALTFLVPVAAGTALAQNQNQNQNVTSSTEIERQLTRGLTIGEPATPERTDAQTQAPADAPAIDLNVQFAFNSDGLTDQARAQLDQLGTALKSDALHNDRFQIAGHTDASGRDSYNLELSRRRATAVMSYLVNTAGVEAARLSPIGYGETKLANPADPNGAVNRRVEVTNLGG